MEFVNFCYEKFEFLEFFENFSQDFKNLHTKFKKFLHGILNFCEIKEKQIHQKSPKNKIFSQIFAIMLSVLLMRKGNGEDTFSVKQRLQGS